jgi:hypothetical protein
VLQRMHGWVGGIETAAVFGDDGGEDMGLEWLEGIGE